MKECYIYCLLDSGKPGAYKYSDYNFKYEPFYIGMGKDNRIKTTLKDGNKNKQDRIKNIGTKNIIREIYRKELYREEAESIEINMIETIGREPNGPLLNETSGGHTFRHSEDSKQILSEIMSGKENPMYGRKHTEEAKRKMSEKRKRWCKENPGKSEMGLMKWKRENNGGKFIGEKNGMYDRKHSLETRRRMSEIYRRRPKISCQHCNREFDAGNYSQHHGNKCKFRRDKKHEGGMR